MAKILLCYQPESTSYAIRIARQLSEQYGTSHVVGNIEALDPSEDTIGTELHQYEILIVVIGEDWGTSLDDQIPSILPNRIVHRVLSSALKHPDITIIPVLINEATMPPRKALPEQLEGLAGCTPLQISDYTFHHDISRLIQIIDNSPAGRSIILEILSSKFDFTMEDLDFNKQGKISIRQRRRINKISGGETSNGFAIIMCIALFGVCYGPLGVLTLLLVLNQSSVLLTLITTTATILFPLATIWTLGWWTYPSGWSGKCTAATVSLKVNYGWQQLTLSDIDNSFQLIESIGPKRTIRVYYAPPLIRAFGVGKWHIFSLEPVPLDEAVDVSDSMPSNVAVYQLLVQRRKTRFSCLVYRQSSDLTLTHKIVNQMKVAFGAENIMTFSDNQSIDELAEININKESMIVVMIDKEWGNTTNMQRLSNPDDPIGHSIRIALEQNATLIPILLNGVTMPSSFPPEIQTFGLRNAISIDESNLLSGINQLISATAAHPTIQAMVREELELAFSFTPEDLALNKEGRISPYQYRRFKTYLLKLFLSLCATLPITLMGSFILAMLTATFFITVAAGLLLIIYFPPLVFLISSSIFSPPHVKMFTGKTTFKKGILASPDGYGNWLNHLAAGAGWVKLQDEDIILLGVPPDIDIRQLSGKKFTVYCITKGFLKTFLSIEPA